MNIINYQIIQFVVMFLIGIFLNPMNVLAYRFNDLYKQSDERIISDDN